VAARSPRCDKLSQCAFGHVGGITGQRFSVQTVRTRLTFSTRARTFASVGPTTSVWGQSAKPTVRLICTHVAGCAGGYATNTRSRVLDSNVFRKQLFILCSALSISQDERQAFRGHRCEFFPRAGCGKPARPGSMSGNRKQSQVKPTEVVTRKLNQQPPGDYSHCACSRLYSAYHS
jgi:hypothetical protein